VDIKKKVERKSTVHYYEVKIITKFIKITKIGKLFRVKNVKKIFYFYQGFENIIQDTPLVFLHLT